MLKDMHFGEHVTIDGYGGSFERLNNKEIVLSTLTSLVNKLSMKTLAPAQVFSAAGNDKKDPGGWSGYVIIEESHISIHTFPKRGFVSADVYTCQNGLALDIIEAYFREQFKLKDIETNFIKRGTRYPDKNIY